ncbi:hypothetical protein RD792_008869 [Penstemon davidsonii]|uniref:F-box domain-containing protein n=1 Tax=Penstemon davidsonii TaxID=160366 RepID=A0ABR0DAF7_9LAMI|nr:hypothetical protein RD792_008869 [Penstemon davidsonii]
MEFNPIERKLKMEGIDWISNMPDSILCKILYYLPTKDVVATSVLSTRWKNLSPFEVLPIKLDLDDSMMLHPKKYESSSLSSSFIRFVDKLFDKTLHDVPCVDELVLKCHMHCYEAKIVSWVYAALRLKLRHLVLDLSLDQSNELFVSLKDNTALTSLELGRYFDLCLPNNFTLPNLQCLHLHNLTFHGEGKKSINELLAGCPKLEKLWFTRCNLRPLGVLYIQSFMLKNFTTEDSWNNSECHLVLETPNLEVLSYCDCSPRSYTLSSFESLLAAHVDVEGPLFSDDGVAQLVDACSSTTKLYLAASSIEALHRSSLQLPLFQNLTCLSLGCLGFYGWSSLARLLWSAPNLESLVFEEV